MAMADLIDDFVIGSYTIDFEAIPDRNGRLYPVEIGLARLDGKSISSMICPMPGWSPGPMATREQLSMHEEAVRTGRPAPFFANWIHERCATRTLISDACFVDQPLLDMLFHAAGQENAIRLEGFFPLVDGIAKEYRIGRDDLNRWIREIDATRGQAHRAGEDARVRAALLARMVADAEARGFR